MSYDNAEPKALKFLISNGDLIDDSGNVIAHSDSLQDMYIKSTPQVKKYLLSDGSVVDENNNLIIKNEYFKKMYDQADPKVAKYLHADGTIDENESGGGGSDLEDNHSATINVSTYTNPVEINPTSGKDGMKKVTVTLSNIINNLYYYGSTTTSNCIYLLSSSTPKANDIALLLDNGVLTRTKVISFSQTGNVDVEGSLENFRRNSTNDISLV